MVSEILWMTDQTATATHRGQSCARRPVFERRGAHRREWALHGRRGLEIAAAATALAAADCAIVVGVVEALGVMCGRGAEGKRREVWRGGHDARAGRV